MEGPRRPSPGTRVLVVSTDPLGQRMPGPAIRAWHLAEILAAHCRVTLVSTVACQRDHPELATGVVAFDELPGLAQRHDVV
ncbi:MAG TPA: hypothetical protein VKU91_05135, partial [Acidimicrobiales bacterium]|nr:hypothetical protein [Acidimicrobiales bacterium]